MKILVLHALNHRFSTRLDNTDNCDEGKLSIFKKKQPTNTAIEVNNLSSY